MTVHDPVHDMATSAYLSQQGPPSNGPGAGAGEQEADGVMNLVNTNTSQGYTLPREQVVGSTLDLNEGSFQALFNIQPLTQ